MSIVSLGVIVNCYEGLVLAAESRVTVTFNLGETTFDNVYKLLSFSPPHDFIGVIFTGRGTIGSRTPANYQKEIEKKLDVSGLLCVR